MVTRKELPVLQLLPVEKRHYHVQEKDGHPEMLNSNTITGAQPKKMNERSGSVAQYEPGISINSSLSPSQSLLISSLKSPNFVKHASIQ